MGLRFLSPVLAVLSAEKPSEIQIVMSGAKDVASRFASLIRLHAIDDEAQTSEIEAPNCGCFCSLGGACDILLYRCRLLKLLFDREGKVSRDAWRNRVEILIDHKYAGIKKIQQILRMEYIEKIT